MSYAELLPVLIREKLVQTRPPPTIPLTFPWYYKADETCAFHQGAPGHNVENCYPLKSEVHKMVRYGLFSFKDVSPNVKDNPLPKHGGANTVNMVVGCPGDFRIYDINLVRGDLVKMHVDLCNFIYYYHDHAGCGICNNDIQGCDKIKVEHHYASCWVCCMDSRGCSLVRRGIQLLLDNGTIKVLSQTDDYHEVNKIKVCLAEVESDDEYASAYELFSLDEDMFSGDYSLAPKFYEEGVNLIVPCFNDYVPVEIEYCSKPVVAPVVICLPGHVPYKSDKAVPYKYNATILEDGNDNNGKKVMESVKNKKAVGESSGATLKKDVDDIFKIIKMRDYRIVNQLLQTPSKISILSLLMNFAAHRESLMRVLDQAFVVCDMTLDQVTNVVGNTSCNNLSFCDDEFPDEWRNHNLAIHISMNCKNDSLSNVLIDNGPAINVIPRRTLIKLKYQGAHMHPSETSLLFHFPFLLLSLSRLLFISSIVLPSLQQTLGFDIGGLGATGGADLGFGGHGGACSSSSAVTSTGRLQFCGGQWFYWCQRFPRQFYYLFQQELLHLFRSRICVILKSLSKGLESWKRKMKLCEERVVR
ncbi:unnamed protein product [Vicia faba]|uniref:Uncharacterized protein n=1 Tax=Vicia faba TaxID=3906 RepID=A0AAV0YWH4_VICFA|nr:unnamed protein product [Vicia faba]